MDIQVVGRTICAGPPGIMFLSLERIKFGADLRSVSKSGND